jgi:hypothetical protein
MHVNLPFWSLLVMRLFTVNYVHSEIIIIRRE